MRSKLEAGVSFVRYVKSYKDGPNDFDHVCECKFSRVFGVSDPKLTSSIQT